MNNNNNGCFQKYINEIVSYNIKGNNFNTYTRILPKNIQAN